jgi:hypothetical protein
MKSSSIAKQVNGVRLSALALVLLPWAALAQKDTTRKPSVDIISSYKPVLRQAVKINLSGTQLSADTNRSVRAYEVPAQNLIYAYQPVTIKPLALEQDTNLYLGNRNFVKAGFGSYNTILVKAGVGFGDGKRSLVNLYGDYRSSQGTVKYQDMSDLTVKATGSLFLPKHEVYALASISQKKFFTYGYAHELYTPAKDDVKQPFQEFSTKVGIRNTTDNDLHLQYNPTVQVNFFSRTNRLSETSLVIDAPAQIGFGDNFLFKLAAKADLTSYTTNYLPANITIKNNLAQLAPEVVYQSPRFTIHGGITPTWENGSVHLLPNIYAEGYLKDKVFMLQAGWVGRVIKNTYRNLSQQNPFILPVAEQLNTRETEIYGGIKTSLGKHFNVNAKASFIQYTNFPLFISDQTDPFFRKDFVVRNESRLNNFRVHGDVSFISQDKFTATAGLNLNAYTNFTLYTKAWNTLPMEFTASLRYWALKRLMLKGDLYTFGGSNYPDASGDPIAFKGGTDISAGAEFQINRQFSAFLDVNNILGDKYQRWANYPVYGLNLLGGITVRF